MVSVALHGMALDLWRGTAGTTGARDGRFQQVPLQARLQSASVALRGAEPRPVLVSEDHPAANQPATKRTEIGASGGMRSSSAGAQQTDEGAKSVLVESAASAQSGFRPLSFAEGLVAYRLALLAELEMVRSPPLSGSLHLLLTKSDEQARPLLSVRTSSGLADVDKLWLEAFQRATERAEVPSVLAGKAFELELELSP